MRIEAILLAQRLDTRKFESRAPVADSPLTLHVGRDGLAVLFRFGVAVLFGLSAEERRDFLAELTAVATGPGDGTLAEEAGLEIAPDLPAAVLPSGAVRLRELSPASAQVIADVLAKSVVLDFHESRLGGVFDRIEPTASELHTTGAVTLRGRELLRQIGEVLVTQHRMVGRVEVGERPDVLWDHPELERLHRRLADEYELRERQRALDRKLELISRTLEALLGLVQQKRMLRVEWYIVALILFEIALTLYQMAVPP